MNDLELLRQYVQNGSESAFAELARRYVGLVYSAAMRHLHNPQDAEDVTQAVFLLLARKSRGLSAGVVVPAWLLRATHFASRSFLRGTNRRQRHEMRAATMSSANPSGQRDAHDSQPDWEQVAPVLDEAIASLSGTARDALVLRFFRNKSYREVSEHLSIAEPAARKRVARAVEQLRQYFKRRGVVLSATALEVLVVAHGVEPAPGALAAAAAKAGVKGAAVAAKHAALAHGAAMGMVPASAKVAAVAAAIVLLGGTASLIFYNGHRGNSSAELAQNNVSAVIVAQVQAGAIRGRVLDPSGRPAAGAEVILARASAAVSVYAPPGGGALSVKAGPDGGFEFPAESDATAIVARNGDGVAQVRIADLQRADVIQLVPWGRIEGTLKVGSTPQVGRTIELSRTGGSLEEWYAWRIMHEAKARTDGRGHFVFDRVIALPPGSRNQLELKWQANDGGGQRSAQLWVAPRQTVNVELGGTGRPIIGRLDATAGLPRFVGQLVTQPPDSMPVGAQIWSPTIIPVSVSADGSFRADDVLAGKYNLVLLSIENARGSPVAEATAQANMTVIVPEMSGGRSDQPLDLGTLHVTTNVMLAKGQPVPDFAARLADGKSVQLSTLRGKYVLLYIREIGFDEEQWVKTADLKAIHDRFGDRTDFGLLDVPVDNEVRTSASRSVLSRILATLKSPGANTNHVTTAPTTGPAVGVPQVYLSSATRLFLIGPDGKCVARSLTSRSAFAELAALLPRPAIADSNISLRIERRPQIEGPSAQMASRANAARSAENFARSAQFSMVDGEPGQLSGGLAVLNDGQLADSDDDPARNFFFSYGSLEGRFRMDLADPTVIGQINIYSRHHSDRAPQIFTVYGTDGQSAGFNPRPAIGVDPAACGWTKIADIDTRPASGPVGGQYAVSLAGNRGAIGRFSHLLFVTYPTETKDDWGHTFFSEIEVFGQEVHP